MVLNVYPSEAVVGIPHSHGGDQSFHERVTAPTRTAFSISRACTHFTLRRLMAMVMGGRDALPCCDAVVAKKRGPESRARLHAVNLESPRGRWKWCCV